MITVLKSLSESTNKSVSEVKMSGMNFDELRYYMVLYHNKNLSKQYVKLMATNTGYRQFSKSELISNNLAKFLLIPRMNGSYPIHNCIEDLYLFIKDMDLSKHNLGSEMQKQFKKLKELVSSLKDFGENSLFIHNIPESKDDVEPTWFYAKYTRQFANMSNGDELPSMGSLGESALSGINDEEDDSFIYDWED